MQEAAERAVQSQLDAIEAGVYSNGKFPGRTTYREYLESSKASGEDHGPFTPYLQGALVALEARSEEHTSELQSHSDLVCRLLLEKKNCLQIFITSITLVTVYN